MCPLGICISNLSFFLGVEEKALQYQKFLRNLKIFTVLKAVMCNLYSSGESSGEVLACQKLLEVKITDDVACHILELLKQNTLMLGSAFSLCSVKAMLSISTLQYIWRQGTVSSGNYSIGTSSVLYSKVRNGLGCTAPKHLSLEACCHIPVLLQADSCAEIQVKQNKKPPKLVIG